MTLNLSAQSRVFWLLTLGRGGGVSPWYLVDGITSSDVVAAWQGKGAASLVASYTDLTGNGHTLTPINTAEWNAIDGWILTGTQYFTTDITPASGYTMVIRYANKENVGTLIGQYTNTARFEIADRASANYDIVYGSGGANLVASSWGSGSLGIAGQQPYKNGTTDGGAIAAWQTTATSTIQLGNRGGAADIAKSHIWAAVVYNTELNAGQMSELADNLATPGYSGSGKFGTVVSPSSAAEASANWEPSTIYDTNPQILTDETNVFKMWYSGSNSGRQICYAESVDGYVWDKYTSGGVVAAVIANHGYSCVFKDGETYRFYGINTGTDAMDYYTSADGITWNLDTANVIVKGDPDDWDDANMGNVWVWKEGSDWKMLYEAQGSQWRIGLATSSDGQSWTKYASNPVLSYGTTIGGPYVKKTGSTYYLWAHDGLPSDLYRFTSTDLITWAEDANNPIMVREGYDEGDDQENAQIGDVCFVETGGKVYMYYEALRTQFDRAHIKMAVFDAGFIETGTI